MFILGILSLAQITFIPGTLIIRITKVKTTGIQRLLFVFGFSLIANYIIVFILTALRIYQRPIVLTIFIIEIISLIWLFREKLNSPSSLTFNRIWESFVKIIRNLLHSDEQDKDKKTIFTLQLVVTLLCMVLALVTIYWTTKIFLHNLGSVFSEWDAIMSWNRWAVEWSNNRIPLRTNRYPQLMPTNLSLTYVFIGAANIQIFAKAIAPLFAIGIFLMFFDLALERKSAGLFASMALAYLMLKKLVPLGMENGYSDIPVAFMGFLPIYLLLKAHHANGSHTTKQAIFIGMIFAAGASVTKQPGLYILGLFPFFALILWLMKSGAISTEFWRTLLIAFSIALIIAAPWYVYKEIVFAKSLDTPEFKGLLEATSKVHQNLGIVDRMFEAFNLLGIYKWIILALPIIFFFNDSYTRWFVIIIVPYILLWSAFASYDTRNLAIIIPLICLTAGLGLQKLFILALQALHHIKISRWKVFVWIIPILIISLIANFFITPLRLTERQTNLQKQNFSPALNEEIYQLIQKNDTHTKFLTNYPIQYLPGLNADYQNVFWFNDYDSFIGLLHKDPLINYILMPNYADTQIVEYVNNGITTGKYILIFENDDWINYQLIKITVK